MSAIEPDVLLSAEDRDPTTIVRLTAFPICQLREFPYLAHL